MKIELPTEPTALTETRTAREILGWARELVEPELRAAAAGLPPSMRAPVWHHFGWDDDGGSGKAVRPALVLLAAQAVGGTVRPALPAAVAVELVHNFSLVHDDVMDSDETRRHRPTVWKVFGSDQAILAGDALLALSAQLLAGHPDQLRVLMSAVLDLVEGQSADLEFERREFVGAEECRQMAAGKTGALLGCACALGALAGGGTPDQIRQLGRFGEEAGLAFQFADDLLGIWGEPAVTGKPVFSDLRNRKKSLPVVAALASGTPEGRALAELYRSPDGLSPDELAHAADLVERAGGRAWSEAQSEILLGRALAHLRAATPRDRPHAELAALAQLLARRDS
ncbi:polyprenyl synthetase family protein [Amycolatopsis sacchari]|uniref:Geranylgeranyl diphosphate synthase, type I n=1 Tax=Amycolatopsis sacchari TaxID=115433 RepID=A0A1I3Z764_9PSEU|nr:polyprenyl synthetase family protein [Amycolatopsis sacchari]SFK39938.1 geranylgeranyl diphosphate synthase, type I [Amycolatopsis sacchari]